jgi:putative ABC transport system permease protein
MRPRRLFLRLAVQHLWRRPGRAVLLALAVSVGGGATFTATVLRHVLAESMAISLNRMGADLLVVPAATTVNLTPALLTVEPTPHTLASHTVDAIRRLPGVEVATPQLHVAVPNAGRVHGEDDLIAFDPAEDFSVFPWVVEKLARPFHDGDLIVGGRRPEEVGGLVSVFGKSHTVYAKLGLTGVGPFERGLFVSFDTLAAIAADAEATLGRPLVDATSGRASAVLVRLRVGGSPEQFRFAAAGIPDIQVIAGSGLTTAVRQQLTTILQGGAVFTALTLGITVLMVWGMYAGMLAERRRELGTLLAVGMRPAQLMRLIVAEAALTTGLGGVCGVLLGAAGLALFHRSIGYYFEVQRVAFALPPWFELLATAVLSAVVCCGVGVAGALFPAWRAARAEPFALVRGETV